MKFDRFLTQEDASTLSRLAEQLLRVREVRINFAEKLIELIATSILLPENAPRPDCVCLHSKVTYRVIGTDEHRVVHVVCPIDANDMLAQVSVLAPLALALLGRSVGSIVEIPMPFSQVQYVEIVEVRRPAQPDAWGLGLPGAAAAARPASV
jgi:regulator of nucleoside diphosphate kinase